MEKNILDCGDNSCLFAKVRGGMRTNGGCRCLEPIENGKEGRELARNIRLRFQEVRREWKQRAEEAEAAVRVANGYQCGGVEGERLSWFSWWTDLPAVQRIMQEKIR